MNVQAKAIFSLQQQVTAQDKRIVFLEAAAAHDAEAIGNLRGAAIENIERIEKLEAVLIAAKAAYHKRRDV